MTGPRPPSTRHRSVAGERAHLVAWPLALLGLAFFVLPLLGLLVRAPIAELGSLLAAPVVRTALSLSLLVSLSALTLSLVLGLPLAWLLARVEFPGRRVVRALVTLPMVLPPVVAGVALLAAFGRKGLLGELGLELAFSTLGAVLAATFVAAPFLIVTLEAALERVDRQLEDAAATLGATQTRIFFTVTLPAIRPSLLAGLALSWARALGEFGATITFAGNYPGRTQTLPLAVYETMQSDPDAALAIALILLLVSLGLLVALRGQLGGGR